jgi:hypothetical protein
VVSRASDSAVLEELASDGDNPNISRPFQVWIYGTARELGEVSRRLEKFGWETVSFVCDVRDERKWDAELILTRWQAATEEAVFALSDEIEGAIEGTRAIYDGWETSVEKAN